MTEIANRGQAVNKSKDYLVVPIGVAQAIIDDSEKYSQVGPATEKESSEGTAWEVKWTGTWGGDFKSEMRIHMKKADGALLFWRNFGSGEDNHGAIGKAFYKKYWMAGD